MRQYIVTLRKERQEGHDPNNKKTGECFATFLCTDKTGGHHSILVNANSMDDIKRAYNKVHITRIERVDGVSQIS